MPSSAGGRRTLLFLLPFAVAVLLRIYPYLVYGAPYSTDSFSPIRNTQELLAQSPTPLGGNPIFDGYNIYWPANSIFSAAASLVFNVPPIQVMPLLFPVVGAVTVMVFFLIAEEVSGSAVIASIASLFLATAGFDAIFTAAVTKETYALPLFMLSIFLLMRKTDWKTGALFTVTSAALAISQHATALLFLVVASSVLLVRSVLFERRGARLGSKVLLPLIAGAITLAYFLVYADAGLGQFSGLVTGQSAVLAFAFLAVFIAPVAYHAVSRPSRLVWVEGGFILAAAVGILAAGTRFALISSAPAVSATLLYSAAPYVLGGALAVIGYQTLQSMRDRANYAFVASWLAAVLALGFMAVFSNVSDGLSIVYRLLTFIAAPAILCASIAIQRFLAGTRHAGLAKVLVVVLILTLCVPSAYQTYAASIQKQSLLGGQWAYQQSDLAGGGWLAANSGHADINVSGDLHMQYLLAGLYGIKVDVKSGYDYLKSPTTAQRPAYLVTYSLMGTNGYVQSVYGSPLPGNWTTALQDNSPVVYDNGNVVLW